MRSNTALGNIFALIGIVLILAGLVEHGFGKSWWIALFLPGLMSIVISVLEFDTAGKRKEVPMRKNY